MLLGALHNLIIFTSCNYEPLSMNITAPPETVLATLIFHGLIALTFTWSPVAPDYEYSVFNYTYNILASNCGSCPTTTNYTTVTCTDVPTNGSTCTFAVQAVVCEVGLSLIFTYYSILQFLKICPIVLINVLIIP